MDGLFSTILSKKKIMGETTMGDRLRAKRPIGETTYGKNDSWRNDPVLSLLVFILSGTKDKVVKNT